MDIYKIIRRELKDLYELIEDKIGELTSSIYGYPETMSHDIIYEDAAEFLNSIKGRINTIVEIIRYDESIQEDSK